MKDIKSLYDAAVNYNNATIQIDGIEIRLFISWNVGAESYILKVNNKIIHTTKRAGIKKILKEWMEGKMQILNGSLVKC